VSTLTAERRSSSPARPGGADEHRLAASPTLFDGLGGRPTLDELLAGAWEGLSAHAVVACPICDGTMEPDSSRPKPGRHHAVRGRCRSCATTLS
jgi:hypothetical protein